MNIDSYILWLCSSPPHKIIFGELEMAGTDHSAST